MTAASRPPQTAEELRTQVLARYDDMSKRLQQVARYVLDEPNAFALEKLSVLAERSGVQPSTIVRFAKSFGFDGASQMQRLFRDGLLSDSAVLGYGERVRQFTEAVDSRRVGTPVDILEEFVEGNTLALKRLTQSITAEALDAAVDMIAKADTVYVTAFRRSFPVASYLAYSLNQVDKPTVFVDGVGGLERQQVRAIGRDDLLIAVSFMPYAEEAQHVVDMAVSKGAKVLAITDSLISAVAKPATLALQVRDAEVRKFRSLTATICLAQTLVIAHAFQHAPAVERKAQTRKSRSTKG